MKRQISTLVVGVMSTVALSGGAAAGPYEDGRAAEKRGDYAAALSNYIVG